MSEYAMIKDGIVENVVIWDGDLDTWSPPEGYVMIEIKPEYGQVSIGDNYKDGEFSTPTTSE